MLCASMYLRRTDVQHSLKISFCGTQRRARGARVREFFETIMTHTQPAKLHAKLRERYDTTSTVRHIQEKGEQVSSFKRYYSYEAPEKRYSTYR
jgi:hypothetical protein